jgi:hypothetical protein
MITLIHPGLNGSRRCCAGGGATGEKLARCALDGSHVLSTVLEREKSTSAVPEAPVSIGFGSPVGGLGAPRCQLGRRFLAIPSPKSGLFGPQTSELIPLQCFGLRIEIRVVMPGEVSRKDNIRNKVVLIVDTHPKSVC